MKLTVEICYKNGCKKTESVYYDCDDKQNDMRMKEFNDRIKSLLNDGEHEINAQPSCSEQEDAPISPKFFEVLQWGIELRENNEPISISLMQHRFGLGWPAAAKIYDTMDMMGYLTADEPYSNKKKVNITYEELEKLRASVLCDNMD